MTDEENLANARILYPIGTIYNCVKDMQQGKLIKQLHIEDDGDIYGRFKGSKMNQYVYIKRTNTWAEIISRPEPIVINDYQIY